MHCLLFFLCLISCSLSARWKQCCDFDCSKPVSLSRARTLRYEDSPGRLKFAKHAVMKIIAKNVGGKENLWEAEMYGRKGLVDAADVSEYQVLCDRLTWVPLNDEYVPVVGDYVPSSDVPSSLPYESAGSRPGKEGFGDEYDGQGERADDHRTDEIDREPDSTASDDRQDVGEGVASERTPGFIHAGQDPESRNPLPLPDDEPGDSLVATSQQPPDARRQPSWPGPDNPQPEGVPPSSAPRHEPLVAGGDASVAVTTSAFPSSSPITVSESTPFLTESPSDVPSPPVLSRRETATGYRQELTDEEVRDENLPTDDFFAANEAPPTPNKLPLATGVADAPSPLEDVQKWRQEQLDRYGRGEPSPHPSVPPPAAIPETVQRWRREQSEGGEGGAPPLPPHAFAPRPPNPVRTLAEEHRSETEEGIPERSDGVTLGDGDSFAEEEDLRMAEDRGESFSEPSPHFFQPTDGADLWALEREKTDGLDSNARREDERTLSPEVADSGALPADVRLEEEDIGDHRSSDEEQASYESNREAENLRSDAAMNGGHTPRRDRSVPRWEEEVEDAAAAARFVERQPEGSREEVKFEEDGRFSDSEEVGDERWEEEGGEGWRRDVRDQLPGRGETQSEDEEEGGYGDEDEDDDSPVDGKGQLLSEEISQEDDGQDGGSKTANEEGPIASDVGDVRREENVVVAERSTFSDADPTTPPLPRETDTPLPPFLPPEWQGTQVFSHPTAEITPLTMVPMTPPRDNPKPRFVPDRDQPVPDFSREEHTASADEQLGSNQAQDRDNDAEADDNRNSWSQHVQDGGNRWGGDMGESRPPIAPPTEHTLEVQPSQEESYDPAHVHSPPRSFSFEEEEEGVRDCPPCPSATSSPLHGITEHMAVAMPSWMGAWLLAQGPEVGIVGVLMTLVTLLLSTCCLCWSANKKASKSMSSLKKERVSKRQAEQQAQQLKSEKDQLQFEVQRLQTEVHGCREELEREEQGTWDLENIRQNLEDEKESLSQSLGLLQQNLLRSQETVQQLEAELQRKDAQLAAVTEEKTATLQHLTQLDSQMKEAVLRSQELDAAREQLEQDLFTCRQSLQQQCDDQAKLSEERDAVQDRCQQLQDKLSAIEQQVDQFQGTLAEKEREAETLQQCIHQLSDGLGESEEESNVSKLQRVQSLLDTTKVQTELRVVSEERDMLNRELQEQASEMEWLRAEKQGLETRIQALVSDKELVTQQHQETQMKLKTLTEYFEQKEMHLHKKLGAEELTRQQVETQEALASEKVNQVEQEREKERQELNELRKQMKDIERSLMQQVVTNEKRAEEALSQLRRTEQDLRASIKEVTSLRKRLMEVEETSRRPRSPPPTAYPPPPGRTQGRYSPSSVPPKSEMVDAGHSPPQRRPSPEPYPPPYGPPPSRPPRNAPPPGASLPAITRQSPLHGPLLSAGTSLHPPYVGLPRSSSPRTAVNGSHAPLLNSTHPPLTGPPTHEELSPGKSRSFDSVDEAAGQQQQQQQKPVADFTNKSRPPPPGMESGVPLRPRPVAPPPPPSSYYPPPPGPRGYRDYAWSRPLPRPSSRSEMEFHRDDSLDRDRPPIPGNREYPPFPPLGRGYPPPPGGRYGPERPPRRPPSGPPYSELARGGGPSYPPPRPLTALPQDYSRPPPTAGMRMPPPSAPPTRPPPLQRPPGTVPPTQAFRKSPPPAMEMETNTV